MIGRVNCAKKTDLVMDVIRFRTPDTYRRQAELFLVILGRVENCETAFILQLKFNLFHITSNLI